MGNGGLSTRSPFSQLMRVPVPWVFVLVYLAGVCLEQLVPSRWHVAAERPVPLAVTIMGAALFCAGAVVAGWAWLLFHKVGTTRVPGEASTTLVTRGPYSRTRNPMYVGLTLAYLGEAGLLGQVWPAVLLPLVLAYLNWIVIPVEEARLFEVFGHAHEAYCARVRRWL